MNNLHQMLLDGMKDMFNAEKQLTKALPKMAKMAQNPQLKEGFEKHLRQTEGHAQRVEQACQALGEKPTGMACKAMKGLIEEATEHMKGLKASPCTDAELIALAQKVEHYEIGSYGTLRTWAQMMGHQQVADLLQQNLSEEEQTNELLNQVAEGGVNQQAMEETRNMPQEEPRSTRSRTSTSSSGRTSGRTSGKRTSSRGTAGRSSGRGSSTSRGTSGRTASRTSGRSSSKSSGGGTSSRSSTGTRSGGRSRATTR